MSNIINKNGSQGNKISYTGLKNMESVIGGSQVTIILSGVKLVLNHWLGIDLQMVFKSRFVRYGDIK